MKLAKLVCERKVIVCCGAGGVGKTTTSAALGMAGARQGRRTLVLTIDPARRLSEALGIPPTGDAPVQIDPAVLARADIQLPKSGEIHAWMLDPRVVLEGVVDRFAPSDRDARRIRNTRLYQALTDLIVGLQEYTAAEALYAFNEQGLYDLIVLDTPPSRNALDFLDAPRRLARFLDERTLSVFLPNAKRKRNPLVRVASKVAVNAMEKTFGAGFLEELHGFLEAFGKLFSNMRIHAKGVRRLLSSSDAAFVVVTSPEEEAIEEALFFQRRIGELGLVSSGFILNRSYASSETYTAPRAPSGDSDADLQAAFGKLSLLAANEADRAIEDRKTLQALELEGQKEGGEGAAALPYLGAAAEDLSALQILSNHILNAS